MASDVQIARLALSYVGDRFNIGSLTEQSAEAEQVNLVFVEARDSLLRQHTWNFATKFSSPAAVTGTAPNLWQFMYLYPTDALKIIQITNLMKVPLIRLTPGSTSSTTKSLSTTT